MTVEKGYYEKASPSLPFPAEGSAQQTANRQGGRLFLTRKTPGTTVSSRCQKRPVPFSRPRVLAANRKQKVQESDQPKGPGKRPVPFSRPPFSPRAGCEPEAKGSGKRPTERARKATCPFLSTLAASSRSRVRTCTGRKYLPVSLCFSSAAHRANGRIFRTETSFFTSRSPPRAKRCDARSARLVVGSTSTGHDERSVGLDFPQYTN